MTQTTKKHTKTRPAGGRRPAGSKPAQATVHTIKPSSTSTRLFYRPSEVAKMMGIGKTTVYDNIANGSIPSRRVGNAVLIPASFVNEQTGDAK